MPGSSNSILVSQRLAMVPRQTPSMVLMNGYLWSPFKESLESWPSSSRNGVGWKLSRQNLTLATIVVSSSHFEAQVVELDLLLFTRSSGFFQRFFNTVMILSSLS